MNLTGKNLLVTGGAGFIGSHLAERLVAEKPGKLCVIDNLFLGKRSNLKTAEAAFGDLIFYPEDASRPEVLRRILDKEAIDVVFDLAAIPLPVSFERPRLTFENNVAIAVNLAEFLREGFYDLLVHFSSSEAYGSAQTVPMDESHPLRPTTAYGASKAAADLLLQSYHMVFQLPVAIVRPFNNFGPRQNENAYAGVIPVTIRRILEGKPPVIYGDGLQTREFIYVKDTAEATVRVAQEEKTRGKIINVGRGVEVPIRDLVALISELMGFRGQPLHEPPRTSDVRRHHAGVARLRELTGYVPATSLREGLQETIAWYREILRKKESG